MLYWLGGVGEQHCVERVLLKGRLCVHSFSRDSQAQAPGSVVAASVFLHVSGNDQQRKNLPPAVPSPWPRKGPVGALGTSAPGSSRLASGILVGIGGLWASGSVPELSALVFSLGCEPINL